MLNRRGILQGLVSLPLIGGGVTLIGKAAMPVPLIDVAAAPILGDPRERARYAWQAFASAMREVTAGRGGLASGRRRMPAARPLRRARVVASNR